MELSRGTKIAFAEEKAKQLRAEAKRLREEAQRLENEAADLLDQVWLDERKAGDR